MFQSLCRRYAPLLPRKGRDLRGEHSIKFLLDEPNCLALKRKTDTRANTTRSVVQIKIAECQLALRVRSRDARPEAILERSIRRNERKVELNRLRSVIKESAAVNGRLNNRTGERYLNDSR